MEREVGGRIGMGNTCKPMAVSFQCMTKFTTNKKIYKLKKKKKEMVFQSLCRVGLPEKATENPVYKPYCLGSSSCGSSYSGPVFHCFVI